MRTSGGSHLEQLEEDDRGEIANPDSPGRQPLKQSWWCVFSLMLSCA